MKANSDFKIQTKKKNPQAPDYSKMLKDDSFLSSVLSSLPGVDPNDEKIQAALKAIQGDSTEDEKKKEEKDKKQ